MGFKEKSWKGSKGRSGRPGRRVLMGGGRGQGSGSRDGSETSQIRHWLKVEVTGVGDSLGVLERGESWVASWFWPEHLERWRCRSRDTRVQLGLDGNRGAD